MSAPPAASGQIKFMKPPVGALGRGRPACPGNARETRAVQSSTAWIF
jgi:hypothetical protein